MGLGGRDALLVILDLGVCPVMLELGSCTSAFGERTLFLMSLLLDGPVPMKLRRLTVSAVLVLDAVAAVGTHIL